jgi:chloramphenicol O-acetyltransferase type A
MELDNFETWPRHDHYQFFSTFDYPHFNLCANVDITQFLLAIKSAGASFSAAVMYLIARVANEIPEFRHRVREGPPVVHDTVHPSCTILSKDDLFSFCTVEYEENFFGFVSRAKEEISRVKEALTLSDNVESDNVLFMSSIPWVSFTSFMHPLKLNPADSVPRFAWGKFYTEGERTLMPFSVQGHHAVMDGLHIGRFFQAFQEYLSSPESFINNK